MADFKTKEITYFLKPGIGNTQKAIDFAVKRAKEGDIDKILVATSSGNTGFVVIEAFKDTKISVIPVILNAGSKYSSEDGEWTKNKSKYEKAGIRYVQGIQTFSGVERAVKSRWGTAGPLLIISDALRLFGEGTKVGVEIAIMAADSDFISPNEKVLIIAGTGRGSDTVLLVKPAYSNNFFEFAIQEIICKPIVDGIKHDAK